MQRVHEKSLFENFRKTNLRSEMTNVGKKLNDMSSRAVRTNILQPFNKHKIGKDG